MKLNGLQYMEDWLRREPSHNSFRVWINDDGNIRLEICDFNGKRWLVAPTIFQAIGLLQDVDGWVRR